ncbi:MAG: hypothetical protein QNJ46_34170 [Leptolyngbyaceae cyanobacterium MO_188.B28]|nr:hypothetical protein [Leptolyngbyaceae cyanobacterium MO_188.B28]
MPWLLDNPKLIDEADAPATYWDWGGPLLVTEFEAASPLLKVVFQDNFASAGVIRNWEPTEELVTIPTASGDLISLDLSAAEISQVSVVESGAQIFTLVYNPSNLQPGEFSWNAETQTLTLHQNSSAPLTPGLQLKIHGGKPCIPTDVVDTSLVQTLAGLPVTGKITWQLSAEQHPNGNILLYVVGDDIHELRSRFKRCAEITIAGMPFVVGEATEKLANTCTYPGNFYEFTVPLQGKWSRSIYNELSFYYPEMAAQLGASDKVFTAECTLGGNFEVPADEFTGENARATRIPIRDLAHQVGADFIGETCGGGGGFIEDSRNTGPSTVIIKTDFVPSSDSFRFSRTLSFALYGKEPQTPKNRGAWEIDVPDNVPGDGATNWLSEVQSRLRQNCCFIDFHFADTVRARNINEVAGWKYDVSALQINYLGDCERSPDHRGYGFEFRNARLTGEFKQLAEADESEDLQAGNQEPRWKKRKPAKETVRTGEKDPPPPDDARRLTTLSLNWDVSGDTKEYVETELEDNQPMRIRRWIYGWAYTAREIVNAFDELDGNVNQHWGVVEYRDSTYYYDDKYRVLTKIRTHGYTMRRFKQESDEGLETTEFNPLNAEDAKYLKMYEFQRIPIYEGQRFQYAQFYDYYRDIESVEQPRYTLYTVPTRTGACTLRKKNDPNWTPALFIQEELSFSNAFASMPNPDSIPDDPLPDLITGEERSTYRKITILPSKNTRSEVGRTRGSVLKLEDRYIEEVYESSPQGPQFTFNTGEVRQTQHNGKPSQASQLPPPYELVEESDEQQDIESQTRYEYRLATPGWNTETDPVRDSFDTPHAPTAEIALNAAKTHLKVQDILESVRYQYQIPFNANIRPFDRLQIVAGEETHNTRVTGLSQEIEISSVDCQPLLTATPTQVTAGIDRAIPLEARKVKLPKNDKPIFAVTTVRKYGLRVGDIIPVVLQTRRNPRGEAPQE